MFACLWGAAACAQVSPSPIDALATMPPTTHPAPPDRWTSAFEYDCQGDRYSLTLDQHGGQGSDRQIRLTSIMTPEGPVAAEDLLRVDEALRQFNVVFSASPACTERGLGVTFPGRRREGAVDASVVIWIQNGRIAQIQR